MPRGVGVMCGFHAVQADNALLTDAEGRQYIDFAAGIAVLNTGHRHPRVVQAVQQQLERFTHTAFQIVPYESAIALAERINALAPIEALSRGESVHARVKPPSVPQPRSKPPKCSHHWNPVLIPWVYHGTGCCKVSVGPPGTLRWSSVCGGCSGSIFDICPNRLWSGQLCRNVVEGSLDGPHCLVQGGHIITSTVAFRSPISFCSCSIISSDSSTSLRAFLTHSGVGDRDLV